MADTMLAARLNFSESKPTLVVKEIPMPEPASGEVRIKVQSAGVCLSDVHLISGILKPRYLQGEEVTLGHEVSGVIEKVGANVSRLVGERVTIPAVVHGPDRTLTLGVDMDGGWAQYLVVPEENTITLPDNISFDVGAIIPDAISTPWSAIYDTARVRPAQSVGVWGVGGLGAHAIKLLRVAGAAPIIAMDPSSEARKRALDYGADEVFDSTAEDFQEQLENAIGVRQLDYAFDFAGVQPVTVQALTNLAPEGELIVVGISGGDMLIPRGTYFQHNKSEIKGHYASGTNNLHQLINLIGYGRINFDDSITETLPLKDAPIAVEHLENKVGNPIRIVLHPND